MRGIRKKFCGDAVGDALRAIGRRRGDCDPVPGDFTERERFDMFRYLMHEHVYPCSDLLGYEGRFTYSWTHSAWSWRHGGKRKFIERVKASAKEELAAADYEVYDLRQIRCLIGERANRDNHSPPLASHLDCARRGGVARRRMAHAVTPLS